MESKQLKEFMIKECKESYLKGAKNTAECIRESLFIFYCNEKDKEIVNGVIDAMIEIIEKSK